MSVDKGQVVPSPALKAYVLIVIGHAAIRNAAVAFPHESRQALLTIIGSVVIAISRHAVEVHKDKARIALRADADSIIA